MLHPSTQRLILKLCDMTAKGEIPWTEGEAGTSVYDAEGYCVEVSKDPALILVRQSGGRELERADASDLAATPWPDDLAPATSFLEPVTAMAIDADRVARGTETAIAALLSALDDPQRPPEVAAFMQARPEGEPSVEKTVAGESDEDGAADETTGAEATGVVEPAEAEAAPSIESEAVVAAAVADIASRLNHVDDPDSNGEAAAGSDGEPKDLEPSPGHMDAIDPQPVFGGDMMQRPSAVASADLVAKHAESPVSGDPAREPVPDPAQAFGGLSSLRGHRPVDAAPSGGAPIAPSLGVSALGPENPPPMNGTPESRPAAEPPEDGKPKDAAGSDASQTPAPSRVNEPATPGAPAEPRQRASVLVYKPWS